MTSSAPDVLVSSRNVFSSVRNVTNITLMGTSYKLSDSVDIYFHI